VRDLVDGIAARDVLRHCDAVLSGYMGDAGIGEAILDAVRRVKAENPRAVYCCDPVIGDDDTDVYVRPGIREMMRDRALPRADIITPNRFEVEQLVGHTCATLAGVKQAIGELQALGPRTVLVTSVRTDDTPEGALDMVAGEAGMFHRLRTPLLPLAVNGAGDALAALFLFHHLRTGSAAAALAEAGSAIYGLLRRTAQEQSREILTVAAQQEFVAPSEFFSAVPC
jgi:pyridoxine kinase